MRMVLQEDVRSGPRADGWNQFYWPRSSHLDNWKCTQKLPRFLQASIPCIPCIWCEWQMPLGMLLTTYSWFIQLFMRTFAYLWFWPFKSSLPGCIESTQNERVIWGEECRRNQKCNHQKGSLEYWNREPLIHLCLFSLKIRKYKMFCGILDVHPKHRMASIPSFLLLCLLKTNLAAFT